MDAPMGAWGVADSKRVLLRIGKGSVENWNRCRQLSKGMTIYVTIISATLDSAKREWRAFHLLRCFVVFQILLKWQGRRTPVT